MNYLRLIELRKKALNGSLGASIAQKTMIENAYESVFGHLLPSKKGFYIRRERVY